MPEIMRIAIAPRVPPMIAAVSVDCTGAIGGISCSGSEAKHTTVTHTPDNFIRLSDFSLWALLNFKSSLNY